MNNEIPDNVNLEYQDCPISGNSNDKVLFKASDRLSHLKGEFNVVINKDSGLMRTNPRPSPESIGYYYPDTYTPYDYKSTAKKITLNNKLKDRNWNLFRYNTKVIPEFLINGKMLEIGCASGNYMKKMKDKGWDVTGLEYSKTAASRAREEGLNVIVDTIEEANFKEKQFDVIVGWMVVEHLHDPVLCFRKIRSWLKDDGYFIFSTPNAGSKEFKIFQKYWYDLDVPRHTYLFTPDTMAKILNKTDFKIERILHQRVFNSLVGSFGILLRDKLNMKNIGKWFIKFPHNNLSVKRKLFYPLYYLLSIFGQTGRMTVWAKKQ